MTLEEMIQQMVKNGVSTEDIAKKTQDTLNGIEKVEKEKREKERAAQEDRKVYLQRLKVQLKESLEKGHFTMDDIGAVAALVVAPDYPRWTVDNINEFVKNVSGNIEVQANMIGVSEDELLNKFVSVIRGHENRKKWKQKEKKPYPYGEHEMGEAFFDCVMDMFDRWSM